MPTNLPPQAQALWVKAQEAKTKQEKLELLEQFLSAIPDHKGTEKLRHQIRHQIAVLKEELEEERMRRKGKGVSYLVEKEGAAQIALIGVPDSGKTLVFNTLTGLNHPSTSVNFETQRPTPGMMVYLDLMFQIVDTPSIFEGQNRFTSLATTTARNADVIALVIDSTQAIEAQVALLTSVLERNHVFLRPLKAQVKIIKRATGGVNVMATGNPKCTNKEVAELLRQYGITNALVVINGPADLDDVEAAVLQGSLVKPSVVVLTKSDSLSSQNAIQKLEKLLPYSPVLNFSTNEFKQKFGETVFSLAQIIRIYTKPLNEKNRSARPLILKKGSTVMDVVKSVHSKLLETFEYARVWGSSVKFGGAKVGLDHELADGDVIEIHAR